MRKKWIGIFAVFVVLFCSKTALVFGGDGIFASNNLVYINNTPIQSYIIENQAFVFIEDLQRYGFAVVSDEKEKKLTISKIPGKEPDPLTEEEYRTLTTRGPVGRKLAENRPPSEPGVFLEDKVLIGDWYDTYISAINGKLLIRLSILADFYGDSQWDPVSRTTYVTIESDHPAIRTDFLEEKIRLTKSLGYQMSVGEHWSDLYLRSPDYYLKMQQEKIHLGGIMVALDTSEQDSVSDIYIYLGHRLMEDLGITYRLTGNTLFLQCPQLSANYKLKEDANDVMWMGTVSCVDLKLIANGQEIRRDSPLPVFLSINGSLYISLRVFFDILDYDASAYLL